MPLSQTGLTELGLEIRIEGSVARRLQLRCVDCATPPTAEQHTSTDLESRAAPKRRAHRRCDAVGRDACCTPGP